MFAQQKNEIGAVERTATTRRHNDLAKGAGDLPPLKFKENFQRTPHLPVLTAALALACANP